MNSKDVTAGLPAWATVDLDAVGHNVRTLREAAPNSDLMAVVKADAYGHGLIPIARTAKAAGADWLGAAQLPEALALRAAGLDGPIFTWLSVPGTDFGAAIAADIDVAAYAPWALDEIAAAARTVGKTARVHLKVDTGLGRGGAFGADWLALVKAALALQAEGVLQIVGVWTHFAHADSPDHPTVLAQQERFFEAVAEAEREGATFEVRHLANSAATLTHPSAHADLVRPGLAVYGLDPVPDLDDDFGLVPAMTLHARLGLVKELPEGQGVSYGHTYLTPARTRVGLVPMGYADGIPRNASNVAPVWADDRRQPIAGRVCMDQFMLDLGLETPAAAGDEIILFGAPGHDGVPAVPTAQDWAEATDTISYEIVTRLGPRVPRIYVGGPTA